jgi:hypothetical protein
MVSVQVQRSESRDEALVRLAAQAMERGVQISRTPDGRHWATSISRPGELHYVTGVSCDCPGFMRHQRCTHLAALLASLGWLPEPTPPAPAVVRMPDAPCHNCDGNGWGYGTVEGGRMDRVTCWICGGAGVEPATAIAA